MEKIVIIGSGFSSLTAFLKFEKYNPIVITSTQNKLINSHINVRKNLKTNKLFSSKSLSKGNLKFNLKNNTKLHDRLSFGGNSNIWGGFININNMQREVIEKFKSIGVKLIHLEQNLNGYISNNIDVRQLRDSKNRILDSSNFLTNVLEGFVETIEFKNNSEKINFYSPKFRNKQSLITSKLFLGISFPQLIDLLYRSNLLEKDVKLKLNEFEHKFSLNTNKNISDNSSNKLVIKYDFVRVFKHFFGFQNSLDKIHLKLPIYIDQIFTNQKNYLDLNTNFSNKTINQMSEYQFGRSIHYCNLLINEKKISEYLKFFSENIFGISVPFVDQKKPGPISNDIIDNIWNNF